MIIDRYDLQTGKLNESIIREIIHIAELTSSSLFDKLELKFSVQQIE